MNIPVTNNPDCHRCIEPINGDIHFVDSSYGSNHPTCSRCLNPTLEGIKTANLSDDFKNFLLSLQPKIITICLN